MTMISKLRSRSGTPSSKRTSRELARALRAAPTRSSREEILLLQNR